MKYQQFNMLILNTPMKRYEDEINEIEEFEKDNGNRISEMIAN